MLKNDFVVEKRPRTGLTVRPMRKTDACEIVGMAGMGAGQDTGTLRAQYELHAGNSFVASESGGKIVGVIIGESHPKEFPNGIGITNLIVDPRQKNAGECSHLLVSAMARHCVDHGQRSMDFVVFNNNPERLEICTRYAARKYSSRKVPGSDGNEFVADFYAIDDLAGKFALSKPDSPTPKL